MFYILIYCYDIFKFASIIFTLLSIILLIFNIWFPHEVFAMAPEQDIPNNQQVVFISPHEIELTKNTNITPLLSNSRENHLLSSIPDTWLGPLTESQARGVIEPKIVVVSAHSDFYVKPEIGDVNVTKFYYGPTTFYGALVQFFKERNK